MHNLNGFGFFYFKENTTQPKNIFFFADKLF